MHERVMIQMIVVDFPLLYIVLSYYTCESTNQKVKCCCGGDYSIYGLWPLYKALVCYM